MFTWASWHHVRLTWLFVSLSQKADCLAYEAVDDIWVSLSTARDISAQLGVGEELSRLLDPATRTAWSLDDGDEGGMLHNWKIPQEYLAPSSYSADAMQR
jgi:hypothetical protein